MRKRLFDALRPNLMLPDAAMPAAAWLASLLLVNAPATARYSAAMTVGVTLLCIASRNLYAIAALLFGVNVLTRWFYQVSFWHDQVWVQWSSVSALMDGRNFYSYSELLGPSFSAYLPMGNLFGGLLIAAGIHSYWNFWHLFTAVLWMLPFLAAPSLRTLLLFVLLANYAPLYDYTTAGGTAEISAALTYAAAHILSFPGHRSLLLPGLLFGAFTAMFRQQGLMLAPFVALVAWRRGGMRMLAIFAAMLAVCGGLYIAANPAGAIQASFRTVAVHAAEFHLQTRGGLAQNHTILALLRFLLPEVVLWRQFETAYPIIAGSACLLLFWMATRKESSRRAMALGVAATVALMVFSRGHATIHYLVAAMLPFFAFAGPDPGPPPRAAYGIAVKATAAILGLFAVVPLGILAVGLAVRAPLPDRPLRVAGFESISAGGARRALPAPDGRFEHGAHLQLPAAIEAKLAEPSPVGHVLLAGAVQYPRISGDVLYYQPASQDSLGSLTEGEIHGSADGETFTLLTRFKLARNYNAAPALIAVPGTASLLRAIRIVPVRSFGNHTHWWVGRLEAFAQ